MELRKDYRIEQCLNDIQKYEKWGNLLQWQTLAHLFNSDEPISALAIHNGLRYAEAKMKLDVLLPQNDTHSDEEKEKRLNQIEIDIRLLEEMIKNDLEYRNMLIP